MDVVTLQAVKAALKPTTGLLANRPTAVGSMRYYFATDDAGGCLHLDIASGKWRRVHSRGEINRMAVLSGINAITSTSLTDLRGVYVPFFADGVRPVEVICYLPDVQVATAGENARLSILDVGSGNKLATTYHYAGVANDHDSMFARSGPIFPAAGLNRYKAQMQSSVGTSAVTINTLNGGSGTFSVPFIAVVEL